MLLDDTITNSEDMGHLDDSSAKMWYSVLWYISLDVLAPLDALGWLALLIHTLSLGLSFSDLGSVSMHSCS